MPWLQMALSCCLMAQTNHITAIAGDFRTLRKDLLGKLKVFKRNIPDLTARMIRLLTRGQQKASLQPKRDI